jgi:hypothetical protein
MLNMLYVWLIHNLIFQIPLLKKHKGSLRRVQKLRRKIERKNRLKRQIMEDLLKAMSSRRGNSAKDNVEGPGDESIVDTATEDELSIPIIEEDEVSYNNICFTILKNHNINGDSIFTLKSCIDIIYTFICFSV